MGAESSAQRDEKSLEEEEKEKEEEEVGAPASAPSEEKQLQVGLHKPLQKNGQISSLSSLSRLSEDNTLAEVGQPDGVSVAPKEDVPETMETVQDEVTTQANGEKVEKESPDANEISTVEEKAAEEKPDDASEVGFKKIFRFVGFKFTLKKDKSEEKDPVKLLTVKDKEEENLSGNDDSAKEDEATTPEEKTSAEEKDADTKASTDEAEATSDSDKDKTTDADGEAPNADVKDELAKEEEAKNEEETSPPSQETTVSPFRKFFSGGLFSNLRKKASIKKTKEEQDKEASVEKDAGKTDETVNEQEDKDTSEQETNQEVPAEEKTEAKEEVQASPDETIDEAAPEQEVSAETPALTEANADETKQEDQEAEENVVEEKAATEVSSEAELLSSQEKTKAHGSPLKKLFTGAGLKKLSTKKHKSKKDTESKATESSEQAELQSSTESAEPPKAESGPSSPEESGEHVLSMETQIESSQETEGEVVSDGEKKKEGIIAWSSFKKLVTPKKRVKRPSESEDEAAGDKPAKSATLSSSESAPLGDKSGEEETKEEKTSEEEPKTETTEKLVSSTEEPKKKMDTSVSWEALMCMGGPKKRTRKTSDSDDDDETKIEDDVPAAEGDQERKTEEAILTSQKSESEGEGVSSPEPLCSSEKETTWDTLKRMVMSKSRPKMDEKPEENAETALSDSETPKDESSFSLRKFFPGRRKKKADKQASVEGSGEEDSDTPAVVPLSEYDKPEESEPEAPAEPPAAAQTIESSEERSPSWIQAVVEDDVRDQLSDIPEEAATPKSVDTDIADDENEDRAAFLRASGRSGRRLSTAEVKPVDQAPDAATTPVPQSPKSECAVDVIQAIEPQIHDIPAQTSATVEDVPLVVASEQTEYEPTLETTKSVTNALLEPHAREEAVAICTGLGTKEIAKVAVEKPLMSIIEPVTVIRDALTTELSVDKKPESMEVADLTEDHMHTAQVFQVESTGLEDVVEESKNNILDLQAATGALEPQIEKIAVVSTTHEESGVLQLPVVNANSPKTEIVSPIVPISETIVCTQSVVVSELTIETKETKMEMEQLEAIGENTPVKEIVQTVTEEISSTICEMATSTTTEETEPVIPESIQNTKTPVITETKVLVAPLCEELETKAGSDSEPEQVHVEPTQEQETSKDTVLKSSQETTKDEPLISDVTENVEELKDETNQTVEIEAQSMAITQSIIRDAVDMVSEDAPEPQTPVSPEAAIPVMVQATATTEAEIDTSTELPVVTDTPVPVLCGNATSPQILCAAVEVVDTIAIEVTKNLEEEKEEPTEEVKKAVEVKVSEETIILEEVKEIKAESESDEKLGQTNEDESEETKEEAAEDVKSDEEKPEAPSEESNVKACEMMIHMPVQVVLQTAQVLEEPSVQEEAAQEFGTNGHDGKDAVPEPGRKLPVVTEEALDASVEEASGAAETEKTQTTKCAEVMAQVMEVIEEAVKEIEPVTSEITAAS